jgi:alkylation response protein AidB-like acyl-CoA dehydrogenase
MRTMSPLQNPSELTLEGVRVPDDSVLGKVGFGFYSAMSGINGARLQIAATALGIADHLLRRMIEYAGERVAFDRPIGANQYVQGMIVDSHADVEQARLLLYKLADDIDKRRRRSPGGGPGQAGVHGSRGRCGGPVHPGPRRAGFHERARPRSLVPGRPSHATVRGNVRDPSSQLGQGLGLPAS